VYRWTDAQGQVHLADSPPEAGTPGVETLSLPAYLPAPADDYWSVTSQARRMEAARLARERVRADLLQAQARITAPPPPPAEPGGVSPVWFALGLYPYARPWHWPHADHGPHRDRRAPDHRTRRPHRLEPR
jgi:hypothetical protein